ncbi:ABC transporter substrate-binding protein [Subtercola boreus]|nr:ABC transporter substrate-binding protein [Subtercola boreus]TQL52549.1 carbohydrate ABC transporter substrate-binding protein (CUT1 family) [Subtercola boreus]
MRSNHSTTSPGGPRRRWLPVGGVAFIAASALLLGGCAGGGAPSGGSGDSGGKVTLSFWNGFTGPDGPALQKVVDDFNASQDGVEVQTNIMPWDTLYQKVLTAAAGKDGPDIVAMSASRLPQYIDEGLYQPLDDYYTNADNDSEALASAAVNASIFDGKNYGVPVNLATMLMYYNKDLFTAAGLDPEKPPTSWDEFAAMVPKLTVDENGDGKPEQYAIALGDHETVPMYQPFLWNAGGGVVSEDGKTSELGSAGSLKALNFWVDLVKNKKASPVGLSGADADKLFTTGKAAIEIVGPWATTGFKDAGINFGLARQFAGPSAQTTLADVVSMSIPASADDSTKQAAYTFFKYWNSKDGQKTWAEGSGFPPTRSDIASDITTNPYPAVFGAPDIVDDSQVLLAGVAAGGTITTTIFEPTLQKALNGEGTVDELFPAASDQVQAELDK